MSSSAPPPTRISYDNSRVAITKITGGRSRQLSSGFLRLQSHYLFQAPAARIVWFGELEERL